MMAAGFKVKKLAVQHVRQPGQRMPVAGMVRSERPGGRLTAQATPNMLVFVNVVFVVEVDEFVVDGLAEDGDHSQQEKTTNGQQAVGLPDSKHGARGKAIDRPRGPML